VTPDAERERTIEYKRFAYEGLVERAKVEIEWARRGLALVDRLYPDAREAAS
jgi:PadR family transcriptional regulator, regulator of vanillate utilization